MFWFMSIFSIPGCETALRGRTQLKVCDWFGFWSRDHLSCVIATQHWALFLPCLTQNIYWTNTEQWIDRYTYLLDMCREQERLFAECSVVSRGEARCSHDGLQGSGVETGRCNYKGVATHILWGWYTTSYRRNGISGRRTFKVITEISEYLQYCSNHHNVK